MICTGDYEKDRMNLAAVFTAVILAKCDPMDVPETIVTPAVVIAEHLLDRLGYEPDELA